MPGLRLSGCGATIRQLGPEFSRVCPYRNGLLLGVTIIPTSKPCIFEMLPVLSSLRAAAERSSIKHYLPIVKERSAELWVPCRWLPSKMAQQEQHWQEQHGTSHLLLLISSARG